MEFDGLTIKGASDKSHNFDKSKVENKANVSENLGGQNVENSEGADSFTVDHVNFDKSKTDGFSSQKILNVNDYNSLDSDVGMYFLDSVRNIKASYNDNLVYGLYNNANDDFGRRLNDFFIDHSGVGLKEKSYFFHMLAVMVDAGIPVLAAVKSLAGRSRNKRFQRVLNTVAYVSEKGSSFSDSMSRFGDVFDESEIGIVKSGEATGRLHKMLFKLSSQLDARHELYMKLWGAAIYPIAVFTVLILVAVGMLIWVFPTLLGILQEGGMGGNLPLPTKILIAIQNAVVNYWWLIIASLVAAFSVFKVYITSDYGSVRWDYIKLKIPVIGTLLKKVYVLRFVSLLGILIDAGVPVIKALKITANSIPNRLYRLKVKEVMMHVKIGKKISESLRDTEFLFPADVVQMLSVGESSANLAKVSEKISDQYQREINNSVKKLMAVFEPVMIVFVGLSVALLAMAIMSPIFNLTTAI